jgi:hypothetical protein
MTSEVSAYFAWHIENRLSGRGRLQREIFVRASAYGAMGYGDKENYFVF